MFGGRPSERFACPGRPQLATLPGGCVSERQRWVGRHESSKKKRLQWSHCAIPRKEQRGRRSNLTWIKDALLIKDTLLRQVSYRGSARTSQLTR